LLAPKMGCFRAFINCFHLNTAKNTSIYPDNPKIPVVINNNNLAVFLLSVTTIFHMKSIKRTINLDLSKYANVETGELMLDELDKDTSIKVLKDTNLVVLDSKNYFVVDIEVLTNLLAEKVLKPADLGYIMMLSQTLRSEYNAIYQQTIPHTLESMAELLGLSYNRTTRLVKSYCSKNVMYRLMTATETVYCINPYLTRRRKTLSKELVALFNKFGKQAKRPKKAKK